jgi:outer membrane protein assembly factor BamB
MKHIYFFIAMTITAPLCAAEAPWPQASGPQGTYQAQGPAPPNDWSVAIDHNVLWKTTLPEGGQSPIAVGGDRLFLTIHKPLPDGATIKQAKGSDVVGICLDAKSGKILWQVDLKGNKILPHSGLFSDATSAGPITDGKHVWFTNSNGQMACFDMNSKEVWRRPFIARTKHNAKQCHPMLVGDRILHVEMRDPEDPKRREQTAKDYSKNSKTGWPWMYLRGFDKATGKGVWIADAATAVHSTPLVRTFDGKTMIFHGRGGGHFPPEKPYGFSLTEIGGAPIGKTLWNREMNSPVVYVVSHFDQRAAYAFDKGKLLVLGLKDGKTVREIDLLSKVDWSVMTDVGYERKTGVPFKAGGKKRGKAYPTNHSNILVGDHMYFMAHDHHSIGRANVVTGKVEYVHVPVQVVRVKGEPGKPIFGKHIPSDTQNSRGMNVAPDKRAKGSGWGHVTAARPIAINNHIYISTMIGTVYVVKSDAEVFDHKAILDINDMGAAGKTWTLAGLAYADGKIYGRTLKEVFCIGKK